jgi:hypothetical protein
MKRVVIIEIVEVLSGPSRGERNKRKRQPAFVCNELGKETKHSARLVVTRQK